jgi:hypothetical protein
MTLQEVEAEVAKLKAIAEALLEHPSAVRAAALRNECRRSHQLMRGKFGNVGEKVARLEGAEAGGGNGTSSGTRHNGRRSFCRPR